MTPELDNALKLLDSICAQAPMARDGHIAAQSALRMLREALAPKESPNE